MQQPADRNSALRHVLGSRQPMRSRGLFLCPLDNVQTDPASPSSNEAPLMLSTLPLPSAIQVKHRL